MYVRLTIQGPNFAWHCDGYNKLRSDIMNINEVHARCWSPCFYISQSILPKNA